MAGLLALNLDPESSSASIGIPSASCGLRQHENFEAKPSWESSFRYPLELGTMAYLIT
jgi:hypothetical protein